MIHFKFFKLIHIVWMYVAGYMLWCIFRDQKTIFGNWFSPNEIQGSNSVHQTWPVGRSVCTLGMGNV